MNVGEAIAWLERKGSRKVADGMARYGIVTKHRVLGVSMGTLQLLAKQIGKDHALAGQLWKSGVYEGQMLAPLVDDPEKVTPRQMDAWAAAFDNWATCDTACFCLFDRTPHAFDRVRQWAASPKEFVKRGAFALLASLALHDKTSPDAKFRALLPLVERGARDERNFVKKGVSWALRGVGRRSRALNKASLAVAARLAKSPDPAPRWVGKDAHRELSSPKVQARLKR